MKVTLKKDHTHAGVRHAAGDQIEVTAPEADWLAAAEVIDPLPGSTKRGGAAEEK